MNRKEMNLETWGLIQAMKEDFFRGNRGQIPSAETAAVLLAKAYELGFPFSSCMEMFHIIQGKISLTPVAMMALIHSDGSIEIQITESTDTSCTVWMKNRVSGFEFTYTYNQDKARKAGLLEGCANDKGEKRGRGNYEKQPDVMYRYRAISGCARIVAPHLMNRMYLNLELDDTVEVVENGEVVPDASME